MSESLEHLDGCFPVTSLKEFRLGGSQLLLQGQGPFVSVIDVEHGKLIDKIRIFRRNNVHGFMIDELRQQRQDTITVLVWGGSSLRIINIYGQRIEDLRIACGTLEHAAPDWIYDICPAHVEDNFGLAYLVTGHNSVLSVDVKETANAKYSNAIQLRHLSAGVKSTLYSANILALSSSHILIAAGTVFGEIIVWSCFKQNPKDTVASADVCSSIHHFFTGHEGSIFGVGISDEFPLVKSAKGNPGRFLASCSDDRTIRIWNISDCYYATSTDQPAYVTDGFDLRSTGFGSTAPASISSGSEASVAKCWGHASRIWGVYFLPVRADYPAVVNIVSRGEDATCQLWRLDVTGAQSNGDMKFSLTHISDLSHHAGKQIWSLTLSKTDDDTKFIYTGGNDGAVRISELTYTRKIGNNNDEEPSIGISPYSPKTLLQAVRSKIDTHDIVPRLFAFVSKTSFLVVYYSGLVQLGTFVHEPSQSATTKSQISWENLGTHEDLRSFASIAGLSSHGLAIIGGSTGILRLYNHATRTLTELTKVTYRPVKPVMLDVDASSSEDLQRFRFMIAYPNSKYMDLFDVGIAGSSNPSIIQTKLINPPSIEIFTGSIIFRGKYLVLGGKLGQLIFYKLDAEKESLEWSFIEHRAHGKGYVTFIDDIIEDDEQDPNVGYALTMGRDGNYCVYMFSSRRQSDDTENGACDDEIRIIHRSSAPFALIERAYFDKKTGHFMMLGFQSNSLILWDETTRTEILSLDCGGVHRVWEFIPDFDGIGTGTVVWIKARSLHVLVMSSVVHRPLQLGSHGREIKNLAISGTGPRRNPQSKELPPLIATGGEDTLIRISVPSIQSRDIDRDRGDMWNTVRCLHIVDNHVTGLQQVKWSEDSRFLFSSAGREDFFVWRIRPVPKFSIAILMEAACPREEFESELRIMSFDVLRMEAGGDEDRFLLALVYSNSTIKVFSYTNSAKTPAFELLGRGTYSTNCLTEVHFLRRDSAVFLVTGATDGYLAFWPLEWITHHNGLVSLTTSTPSVRTIKWETHHAIHTSSIKTLELEEISPSFHVLVGGGDDNSLSVTLVKLDDNIVHVVSSVLIPNAHASAITAVKIVRSHSESHDGTATLEIASSGNDQRIKTWSVSVKAAEKSISISLKSNRYCPVADIAAMDVMEVADSTERVLVVGGVGMEMLRLP